MPPGKINIQWLASRLTVKDVVALAAMVKHRASPKAAQLQRKRDKLVAGIKVIEAKIAALKGEIPAKRPGRKAEWAREAVKHSG